MSTVIYYFSATGNCLTTAKRLAAGLGDCRLIPVASTKHLAKIVEGADAVGFVFPVYYSDMPYPVREMICKMVFKPEAYIFAVSTCKGHFGNVSDRLELLLRTRGTKLSLYRNVPMPGNSFLDEPEKVTVKLQEQYANTDALLPLIRDKLTEDYIVTTVPELRPVSWPNNFRGIEAEDNCIGCGTCVKVCPMENIRIENGKAIIGDECATCLSCFHWCPVKAIWISKQENIARRDIYRHPEITLEDIVHQKHDQG